MDAARRGVTDPADLPDALPGSRGAILLAGGRASRVGGAAKTLFEVGGRTLLDGAITAARASACAPITIVGPRPDEQPEGARPNGHAPESPTPTAHALDWLREDPPFGGPAAAAVAALRDWEGRGIPLPEWTLLLACDLPRVDDAVSRLWNDILLLPADTDGVCLADAASRPQWLTGAYRTSALLRAARALPEAGRNASIRALMDGLAIVVLRAPDELTSDVDTWEDLEDARRRFAAREMEQTVSENSSRTLPPEALDEWAAALRERFDLEPDALPVSLILDLARDVANDVARPAAPFSAFVAGLVAGRAGGAPADIEAAVQAVTKLAAEWKP